MIPPARTALLAAAVVLTALPGHAGPMKALPFTRDQMSARASDMPWLFVYGTQDPRSAAALRGRAQVVASRLFGRDTSSVRPDHAVTVDMLKKHALFVLGGPRENRVTREFVSDLPVRFDGSAFEWFGRRYDRPLDAIHLVYPNPHDPARFLLLVAGNSADALTRRGGGFRFGGHDWRIYRDGELVRSGSFAQEGGAPWRYDVALDHDLEREREAYVATLREDVRGAFLVRSPDGVPHEGRLLADAAALVARLEFLGFVSETRGALTLYAAIEAKGFLTRSTRPEHLAPDNVAHVAAVTGRRSFDLWSLAAQRLRARGARAASPWLEPAAVWLCGRYENEPLARSVSRLHAGGLLASPEEAASAAVEGVWRSPLMLTPARALLVQSVYETAGPDGAGAVQRMLERTSEPGFDALCEAAGVKPARVRARYAALADSMARVGRIRPVEGRPRAWVPDDGFQSGVCLAHAVSLERGYASRACAGELATLRELGAGAVSLTPFGYLPQGSTPQIRPSSEGGVDEETDESLVEAGAQAKARGLRVWLKPHLWTRRWVGELEFSPSQWETFFERYREFILHHAILADREGFDGFVVGHELVTASLGHPDAWRAIIADVRRVYGGTLTYGANWGEEINGITFWDALDVIGVSFYEPLAETPSTSVSTLKAGAERALAKLQALSARTGKPVMLAEVGYAPVAEAPVRPWEEQRRSIPDLETQRACYEALVAALEGKRWVMGAFFWKWFSSPDIGGPADAGFSPRGKPAQAVLGRAFREWSGRPVVTPRAP